MKIEEITIKSPCYEPWQNMQGDERTRHCSSCDKSVYNLAQMTPSEITQLIEATEGYFCGRIYRRQDGTIITADCQPKAPPKKKALIAFSLMAAILTTSCSPNKHQGKICPPPQQGDEVIIGEIAPKP